MKDYIFGILTLLIMVVCGYKMYNEYHTNTMYKVHILELRAKKNATASMAKQTLYQDSIDTLIEEWLFHE